MKFLINLKQVEILAGDDGQLEIAAHGAIINIGFEEHDIDEMLVAFKEYKAKADKPDMLCIACEWKPKEGERSPAISFEDLTVFLH